MEEQPTLFFDFCWGISSVSSQAKNYGHIPGLKKQRAGKTYEAFIWVSNVCELVSVSVCICKCVSVCLWACVSERVSECVCVCVFTTLSIWNMILGLFRETHNAVGSFNNLCKCHDVGLVGMVAWFFKSCLEIPSTATALSLPAGAQLRGWGTTGCRQCARVSLRQTPGPEVNGWKQISAWG